MTTKTALVRVFLGSCVVGLGGGAAWDYGDRGTAVALWIISASLGAMCVLTLVMVALGVAEEKS